MIYCPIKWTAYHIQGDYGKDEKALRSLQSYVKSLPRDKKFFTVVQYDDGLLVDFPNCVIFSAGGKPDVSIPIPLVSDRHNYTVEQPKKYLASFMGNLKTHQIREKMAKALAGNDDIYIGSGSVREFEEITAQSHFSLCPRGYGKTSFRLYEAMELGAVPVYISDEHWLPFNGFINWNTFCVLETDYAYNIKTLPETLRGLVKYGHCSVMKGAASAVYNCFFEYDKCFEMMRRILESDYNKTKAR